MHVVQPGENLFRIALRYNTTVEAIAAANGIRNPQLIYVGQRLTIPRGGDTTPPQPKAVISGPTSGLVGQTLSFSGADSTDKDGRIVSYAWDFGDGTTGSGVSVTHAYNAAGSYKVTLTVTDDGGLSDSATHNVQAEPVRTDQPPTAVISGPTSGLVGQTLSFSGADSTDKDGRIVSYAWDFGDGTTGSGVSVTHAYNAAGSYKVTLTVTDDGGLSDSATHNVQVEPGSENRPPKAVISGPTSGLVGETLSFSGANSTDEDGRIVSYAWDFGDGTTGSGVSVTHAYNAAGSYKVTLTVTDDGVGAGSAVPVPINFAPYIWAKAGTLPHIWGALPAFSVLTYELDSQGDGLDDSVAHTIQIYESTTAMVKAEWPKKMEIDRSDSIRVSLIHTTDQRFVPTIEIAGHTVIAARPSPVGTLEAPIEEAFGSEYKAYAIANLAGAAFKISPVTTEYQSLEQPEIKWVWNIMPEKPDLQTINVSIQVKWEPIGSDGETIQRQIWDSQLDIFVEKPLIATGQLNLFSLVSLFVGSTLSVPWLYERIRETREKRQKDEESKPKIYRP